MSTADYAEVAIKPPLLFLGGLVLGSVLTLFLPIGPGLASPNSVALAVGIGFVVLGLTLAGFSVRAFRRAGTNVVPGEPATALVVFGPYHIMRNPIYVGFVLVYFGLSIVLTSVWVLALLAPVLVILQRGVIVPEETYLDRKFGEDYRRYCARVPPWL